ncbi:MAG: hypothetical protein D6702_07665 [Planctomycetota bacterium]|nr:MAG: hypothetical protein D6702_07665 [Planctomycetota bacterium]
MPRTLPILAAALLLAAALPAQSNATTSLITYGDVLGAPASARLDGATPGVPAFLVPSFQNTGSNYLVAQTGDPNDALAVGIDLAAGGTYFSGVTDAAGSWTVPFAIPANPTLLDRDVFFQALTRPGGGGAAEYDDFSNLRWLNLNQHDRWQGAGSDLPLASALVASAVLERGPNGRPLRIFSCGGGPALVTAPTVPYPCSDQAWIYDARTGQTTLLPGRMATGRAFHTATVLDDGRVLVTGGVTYGGQKANGNYFTRILNDAEIWDPATGQFTVVPMLEYRAGHTANKLPDGRVLIAGGTKGNGAHELTDVSDLLGTSNKNTEIFDPATDTFSQGPWLSEPKAGHGGVTLQDGRIWLAGGITHTTVFGIPIPDFSTKVDIYDPATGAIVNGGNIGNPRALFGAELLADGRVAVIAGAGGDIFNIGPISACQIWDPNTNSSTALPALPTGIAYAGVAQLDSGAILVVGGAGGTLDDPIPVNSLYEIDPAAGTLSTLAPMAVDHAGGVVALLEDGTLYVGGGESNAGVAVATAESYSR